MATFDVFFATRKNNKLSDQGAKYVVYDDAGSVKSETSMSSVSGGTGLYYAALDTSGWTRSSDARYLLHMYEDGRASNYEKSEFVTLVILDGEIYESAMDSKVDTVDANVDSIITKCPTNYFMGSDDQDDHNAELEDWADGGRLDLILDELTTQGDTTEGKVDTIDTNVDAVLVDTSTTIPGLIGTPVSLDSGTDTLAGMLTKMADDNGGADFDAGTDSLQEIRDHGDSSWGASGVASYTAICAVNSAGSTKTVVVMPLKNGMIYTSSSLSLTCYRAVAGGSPVTEATYSEASPGSNNTYDLALGFTPSAGETYYFKGTVTMDAASKTVGGVFVAFGS